MPDAAGTVDHWERLYRELSDAIRSVGERHGFSWEPDEAPKSMLARLGNALDLAKRRERAVAPDGSSGEVPVVFELGHREARALFASASTLHEIWHRATGLDAPSDRDAVPLDTALLKLEVAMTVAGVER